MSDHASPAKSSCQKHAQVYGSEPNEPQLSECAYPDFEDVFHVLQSPAFMIPQAIGVLEQEVMNLSD